MAAVVGGGLANHRARAAHRKYALQRGNARDAPAHGHSARRGERVSCIYMFVGDLGNRAVKLFSIIIILFEKLSQCTLSGLRVGPSDYFFHFQFVIKLNN